MVPSRSARATLSSSSLLSLRSSLGMVPPRGLESRRRILSALRNSWNSLGMPPVRRLWCSSSCSRWGLICSKSSGMVPERALRLKSSTRSSSSSLKSLGMVPVSRLLVVRRDSSLRRRPSCEGSEPTKRLLDRSRVTRSSSLPSSVGREQLSALNSTMSLVREVMRPISVGRQPVRLLLFTSKCFTAVSMPTSVGSAPEKEFFMSSTKAHFAHRPISEGTEPVSRLSYTTTSCSSGAPHHSVGSVPARELRGTLMRRSQLSPPNSEGSVPESSLSTAWKTVSTARWPTSVGMEPVRPMKGTATSPQRRVSAKQSVHSAVSERRLVACSARLAPGPARHLSSTAAGTAASNLLVALAWLTSARAHMMGAPPALGALKGQSSSCGGTAPERWLWRTSSQVSPQVSPSSEGMAPVRRLPSRSSTRSGGSASS
mmetsp:Transcript_2190/g.6323  ORF Transcript_2190/g.6323 Transcript_2190/m.6323 type:complete len:429 (-) Transcript_2190:1838-3124(-)